MSDTPQTDAMASKCLLSEPALEWARMLERRVKIYCDAANSHMHTAHGLAEQIRKMKPTRRAKNEKKF